MIAEFKNSPFNSKNTFFQRHAPDSIFYLTENTG